MPNGILTLNSYKVIKPLCLKSNGYRTWRCAIAIFYWGMRDYFNLSKRETIFPKRGMIFSKCETIFPKRGMIFSKCETRFSKREMVFSKCKTMFSKCEIMFSKCETMFQAWLILSAAAISTSISYQFSRFHCVTSAQGQNIRSGNFWSSSNVAIKGEQSIRYRILMVFFLKKIP